MSDSGSKIKEIKHSTEATASGGAAHMVGKGVYTVQDALHTTHLASTLGHAHNLHGIFEAAPFGWLGVAAGTSVSAYFNHLAHRAKAEDLMDNYRPQIGSIVGKTPDKVKLGDLERVAEVNPALNAEMKRSRKLRDTGTLTMALATTVAFVGVFAAIALFPPLTALAGAAAASGLFSAAGLGFVATTGLLSWGLVHAAGSAIGAITKKAFKLDKHSVEDHVQAIHDDLKDGKVLSQEQVLGVFASASPGLEGRIKYTFGKDYDNLSADKQAQAVVNFGRELDLEGVTNALNSGELPAREMPFFVHGQSSGAPNPQAVRDKLVAERRAEQDIARQAEAEQAQPQVATPAAEALPTPEAASRQWQDQVSRRRQESLVNAAASARA